MAGGTTILQADGRAGDGCDGMDDGVSSAARGLAILARSNLPEAMAPRCVMWGFIWNLCNARPSIDNRNTLVRCNLPCMGLRRG